MSSVTFEDFASKRLVIMVVRLKKAAAARQFDGATQDRHTSDAGGN